MAISLSAQDRAAQAMKRRRTLPVRLKLAVKRLYLGSTPTGVRFRVALLGFDVITISFFIVSTFLEEARWMSWADAAIGMVLLLDLAARLWLVRRKGRYLLQPATLADTIVIVSLLAGPVTENLAFLRVMRALRLLHSYPVLGKLRRRSLFLRRHEEVILSALHLLVFIFVITAIVYVTQNQSNPAIRNYIDALYFTITTLTTTGFGDITLVGDVGHLLAVLIMVFGISLFLRLVQTLFRPAKVRHTCSVCGLTRHDPDAIHCKHCGTVLNIPSEGAV